MKIVTANIGRTGMTTERVRDDFRKIKYQPGAKFTGFQEIDEADPADEHGILNRVFRRQKKVGMNTREPIVAPPTAKVLDSGVVVASHGIAGASPTRYLVWAIFKYRGKEFAMVNTHYTAFAWNNKQEPFEKRVEAAWQQHFAAHSALVKKLNDQGYTVFWTGDVNRKDMPKVHPQERQLVTAGIDSISVVEGKYKVKVFDKGSFALNSDHDARWVRVGLV